MYKRLIRILTFHILIIIFWGVLLNFGKLAENLKIVELAFYMLMVTVLVIFYTEISNKDKTSVAAILNIISLGVIASIPIKGIECKIILIAISLASTGIYIKKYFIYKNIKGINIIPISKNAVSIFAVAMGILIGILVYLFDIDRLSIGIIYNILIIVFEMLLIFSIRERENNYEKIYKMYYLSDYISKERDEFARVIHDEIIQDIFAAKNYLSLKEPNISLMKEVLKELEIKSRKLMKFYQSNIFEDGTIDISLEEVFENIKSLYMDKNLEVNVEISDEIKNLKNENIKRLILIITRELVNNVYKHSDGSYLNYKIFKNGKDICINLESNGAVSKDISNIEKSTRGVMVLKLLVESNSGKINYNLKKDLLSTTVELEVEDENSITRRS